MSSAFRFPDIIKTVPFVWTTICCVSVYAFGLPLYSAYQTSLAVHVVLTCVWGLLGIWITIGTIIYLIRAIVDPIHFIDKGGALLNVLFFFDVWFSLLTMQAAILYIPEMFSPNFAFTGLRVENGPWYTYLQLFITILNNFHGAKDVGVIAISVVPMLWLAFCSILARMFMLLAIPIVMRFTVFRAVPVHHTNGRPKTITEQFIKKRIV